MIDEFNIDSKAECVQLTVAHSERMSTEWLRRREEWTASVYCDDDVMLQQQTRHKTSTSCSHQTCECCDKLDIHLLRSFTLYTISVDSNVSHAMYVN